MVSIAGNFPVLHFRSELLNVFLKIYEPIEIRMYQIDNTISIKRKGWESKSVPENFFENHKLIHYPAGLSGFNTTSLVELIDKERIYFNSIKEVNVSRMRGCEEMTYWTGKGKFSKKWAHPLPNIPRRLEHAIEICYILSKKFDSI